MLNNHSYIYLVCGGGIGVGGQGEGEGGKCTCVRFPMKTPNKLEGVHVQDSGDGDEGCTLPHVHLRYPDLVRRV